MSAPSSSHLALHRSAKAGASISPQHERFNSLMTAIVQRREALAAVDRIEDDCQRIYAGELAPLHLEDQRLARELVLRLDAIHTSHSELSSSERQTLSGLILRLLDVTDGKKLEMELKAIHRRHCSADYEHDMTQSVSHMKAELEQMFGESLGADTDLHSQEDLLQRARTKLAEQEARETAKEAARAQKREARRAKKSQGAQDKAAHAASEDAATTVAATPVLNQPLRDIYRRLASALHPDREPNDQLRLRKTAMMQSLNQAYAAHDLLRLLELQMELGQIDEGVFSTLSDERLGQYNRLLKEQLAELEQKLDLAQSRLQYSYGLPSDRQRTAANIVAALHEEISRVRLHVEALQSDLKQLDDDVRLKRWLKDMRKRMKEDNGR